MFVPVLNEFETRNTIPRAKVRSVPNLTTARNRAEKVYNSKIGTLVWCESIEWHPWRQILEKLLDSVLDRAGTCR